MGYSASPVFADIDGDSDLDLFVGEYYGFIKVFTNDGSGSFTAAANLQADGSNINVGYNPSPVFADIDGDSDLDLYIGENYGSIKVFTNDGSGNFTTAGNLQSYGSDIDVESNSSPEFADIDGDSDLDLYVGNEYGIISVFTNDGSGNFSVADTLQANGSDINVGSNSSPVFADIDGDNDLDLYVGGGSGYIELYTNNGSGIFSSVGNLQADGADINVGYGSSPVFANIDGNLNLFIGNGNGNILVYQGLEVVNLKEISETDISIYPNPATSQLTINSNQLSITNITIIDITGKTVKSINKNTNTVDVSNLQNGLYILQVQTQEGISNSTLRS